MMDQILKGKVALVLGGGGSRGAYQIGVWQALRELDVRLDIITGTSVGAINGALILQNAFDPALSLWRELETNMVFDMDLKEIVTQGGADSAGLQKLLDEYISEDKIRESSLEYGIVTAELPGFTPHYLFKEDIPKSKLRDYILASASCFPAIKSHAIDDVKFVDGGYIDNLPVGMALQKGAALVIAVDLDGIGVIRKKELAKAEYLSIIGSAWNLGNFLVFDKNNSQRIIRLGYLDAMKSFHVFDGHYYTFPKGEFDKRSLKNADAAAKIFELDPLCIYKKFTLNRRLSEAVRISLIESQNERKKTSALFKGNPLENLINLSKAVNKKVLTAIIAKSLTETPAAQNVFLKKSAIKLLEEELKAASYLSSNGLL